MNLSETCIYIYIYVNLIQLYPNKYVNTIQHYFDVMYTRVDICGRDNTQSHKDTQGTRKTFLSNCVSCLGCAVQGWPRVYRQRPARDEQMNFVKTT